jgi:hypothetical protein
VLLVREDGCYEVTIPGWGHVGEESRRGQIGSLPRRRPGYRDVESAIARLAQVRDEVRVGYHHGHPFALLLANMARSAAALDALAPTAAQR